MREPIWDWLRSKLPEGMILPWWALAVRAVLFPLDTFYWRMSRTRGYQFESDTWVIEGIIYKVTRIDGVVRLERVHQEPKE